MDRLEIAVMRAEQARQVLDNPLFSMAFEDIRKAYFEAWVKTSRGDSENARDIHRMIECLDRVQRALKTHIDTGKLAEDTIKKKSLFTLNR